MKLQQENCQQPRDQNTWKKLDDHSKQREFISAAFSKLKAHQRAGDK